MDRSMNGLRECNTKVRTSMATAFEGRAAEWSAVESSVLQRSALAARMPERRQGRSGGGSVTAGSPVLSVLTCQRPQANNTGP